ncbi:hypothetical protein CASFOL_017672 [Castilleja foliolosa]|uniref:Uncharacterized protein n=1 Tax=Castilleja foliolosa TaxID=1961234 RepID=A0ABD3D7L3_9LAMI
MALTRCFMFALVLIVLNFSYIANARALSKNSILLNEDDSTKMDPSYLGDEKIPPEVLCSLLGGCDQKSMETSKSTNHISTQDVSSKIESRAVEPRNFGDAKIPPEVLCSLLGGCEKSIKTSKSANHHVAGNSNGIKDSTIVSHNHLGDEKLPISVLCSLLGGC